MKSTSIKCFHEIKDTIPAKEREVLALIKKYGPLNGRMVDGYITGGHKRLANLSDYGCIGIAYIAEDSTTGRETIFYMWLTDTPKSTKPITKKSKDDPLKLHELYDKAYAQAVRDTLGWINEYVYTIKNPEATVQSILGRKE